jgi:L-methionine (R)-S-oxide reductase
MAETTLDVTDMPKAAGWAQLEAQMEALLDGMDDIGAMATISSVVHHGFGHLWTGFYRTVAPGLLRVGPYQGTLGCGEIAFGKGVCGTAAAERRTVIVPDVTRFANHITCDSRARSEIVVPVYDAADRVVGVFDVDSAALDTFDPVDAAAIERIVRWFRR